MIIRDSSIFGEKYLKFMHNFIILSLHKLSEDLSSEGVYNEKDEMKG